MKMCVCVCVCERERMFVCACEYLCVCVVSVYVCVCKELFDNSPSSYIALTYVPQLCTSCLERYQ